MRADSRRSHTAEGVAALRAVGARETDPVLRNPDGMAEGFIGPVLRARVAVAPLRWLSVRMVERMLPGLYRFITARTKHFDELFLAEIAAGAEQLVLLGAGADSRPYRFAERLEAVATFELDHPATSEWKREAVRRRWPELSEKVTYAAVDFDRQPLAEALADAGVRRDRRTVFIWEGVTPYLSAEAIESTLRVVAGFSAGSSIIFDYLYRAAVAEPATFPDAVKYLTYMSSHGEPLVWGWDPDAFGEYLGALGLELASHACPAELSARHLGGDERILSFSAIAHARTAP